MIIYIPTLFKYCVKFLLTLGILLFCNIGCNVDQSKNILGEAEEIEKKQAMDLALETVKTQFNENLKKILGE